VKRFLQEDLSGVGMVCLPKLIFAPLAALREEISRRRGDQLARQWRILRAAEDSLNGLTAGEIAKREETGIRTLYCFLEWLQRKCHVRPQSTPREIFRLLFSFLNIFLTPSRSIRKTIKRFSAIFHWRSLRLDERQFHAKPPRSLRVREQIKKQCSLGLYKGRPFAPWREIRLAVFVIR
jgi:hypothetical protein